MYTDCVSVVILVVLRAYSCQAFHTYSGITLVSAKNIHCVRILREEALSELAVPWWATCCREWLGLGSCELANILAQRKAGCAAALDDDNDSQAHEVLGPSPTSFSPPKA